MSSPFRTGSPSLMLRTMTLPGMSALILTCVLGSILPGARTRDVTSWSRTFAICTDWTRPLALRAMLMPITTTSTTAPSAIQIHFFFIACGPLLLLALAAHPVDERLGHADVGERGHQLARRPLQLQLRVDEVEDRGRADVVLLLDQVHVLGGGLHR